MESCMVLPSRYTMVRAPVRYQKNVFQGILQTNMMAIDLPKKVPNLKENSGDRKARKPIRTSEQAEWNGITFFSWLPIVLFLHDQKKTATNVPVKSKLPHPSPPGQPPGHLGFWKIFVQISLSPGRKAVQMPPPPGKLPDYCFNFSVAFTMLLKLCM